MYEYYKDKHIEDLDPIPGSWDPEQKKHFIDTCLVPMAGEISQTGFVKTKRVSVDELYENFAEREAPIVFDGEYDADTNPAATVATVSEAVSSKADMVDGATDGNFASLDSNGNLADSGHSHADYATAQQGAKADKSVQGILVNGSEVQKDASGQVDIAVPVAYSGNPQMDGTESAGTSTQWAKGDHVHPTDTTRETAANRTETVRQASLADDIHYPSELAVRMAIDSAVAAAYRVAGTKTADELVPSLLVAENVGNIYNVTTDGETDPNFVEGPGVPINAGDNVGICDVGGGVYKFDLMSGLVDLTDYVRKSSTAGLIKNDGTIDTNQYLTSHQGVTDGNPTLAWGTQSIVGTVGSTELRVTMPANPATGKQEELPKTGTTYDIDVSGNAGTSDVSDAIYMPRNDGDYDDDLPGSNRSVIIEKTNTAPNRPDDKFFHVISSQGTDVTYGSQFAIPMLTGSGVYYRVKEDRTWDPNWHRLAETDGTYSGMNVGYASRAGVATEVPWSGVTSKPATSLTISLSAVNLYTTLSQALNSMMAGTANYAWLNITDESISNARIAAFHSGSVSGIYYIVLSFYTMDNSWMEDATKPWTLIVLSEKYQNCDRLFIPPHDTSFGGKYTSTGDFANSAAIGSLGYSGFANYGYPGTLLWRFEPSLKLGWENTAYSGTTRPELFISKNADLNEWLREANAKTYATMNILGKFNGTERSKYLSSYHYHTNSQGAHEILSLEDSYGLVRAGDFYKIEVEVWAQTDNRQAAFHYTLSGMMHEEDGATYGDYWWTGYYGGSAASGQSTYWPGLW